ncbi:cell division protein FtsL [Cognatishimia sp.]|uniref:cell division protein FtsL n=1 Tax=Cognatishimia sp. TaxID=2211648 RepID=UPI003518540E|nr:cell division protein FtsL [Cognatishimia sp.]
MRSLLYVMTALSVIALAFWAYRENYATQQALGNVEELRYEISEARDRLAILKAEWAYLNRPDRLLDLADLNFSRLQLLPLQADQFGMVEQVSYPPVNIDIIDDVVEVSNQEASQ